MAEKETIFAGIILSAGTACLFILLVLFSTLAGAIVGWIVGWFFGDTILGIMNQLGVHNIAMWQLGAFLGFVGSFFRHSHASK
jgi:membrane protein YqaA with SNARE-associated domain